MSLSAEILMRRIPEATGPMALVSDFGDVDLWLDRGVSSVQRFARRPVGGIVRRPGFAAFKPPLSVADRQVDCARLARTHLVVVDAVVTDAEPLMAEVKARLAVGVAVLRVRGAGPVAADPLALLFGDEATADRIFIRRDLLTDELAAHARALAAAEIDEFDMFMHFAGPSIHRIRHGAGQSEVIFHPPSLLDQPDPPQIAAALGEGRLVMAADKGFTVFAPQFSGAPTPITVTLSGITAGDADPVAYLPNAENWRVDTARQGDQWRLRAAPPLGGRPVTSVFVEIEAAESHATEITEIATTVTRSRGGWEIWDEAQSQLELEESW